MDLGIIANAALGTTVRAAAVAVGLTPVDLAPIADAGSPAAAAASDRFGHRVGVVVVALEGLTLGEIVRQVADVAARGEAALAITVEGDCVVAGPLTVAGATGCIECRLRHSVAHLTDADAAYERAAGSVVGRSGDVRTDVVRRAVDDTITSIAQLPGAHRNPLCTSATVWSAAGRRVARVLPAPNCRTCSAVVPAIDSTSSSAPSAGLTAIALAELGHVLELDALRAETEFVAPEPDPQQYRTVAVVGGGTAGYLAALALRNRRPELEVTVIESSAIPIIGVGEATTPAMVNFLHHPARLGLDIVDFHRRVRPTLKLGIRFKWGDGPAAGFSFPFQYAPLGDAAKYDGAIDNQTIASLLMSADRSPILGAAPDGAQSLLDTIRFAYHLDNVSFVDYLADAARVRGVRHLDATVVTAARSSDGEEIDHLVTDDGRCLRFDLYIDATGFASVLMGRTLGSRFTSFAASLFTDRAIVASAPHDGVVKPYTGAATFGSGWCWTIPFDTHDHLGYVYSSAFVDDDQARDELQRNHPDIGETRVVEFVSGRREHFLEGNVVAIGNAYGFVEPLESTALHMVIRQLDMLVNHFPDRRDRATKDRLNRDVARLWDGLRWFLAVHYRYNRRVDSPFWRAVRADADVSGVDDRLAAFAERAPLSDRPPLSYSAIAPDFFAGDQALDTLLLGQGVDARLGPSRRSRDEWAHVVSLRHRVVARAMPHAEALDVLRNRQPELLGEFVADPDSWIHGWIPR